MANLVAIHKPGASSNFLGPLGALEPPLERPCSEPFQRQKGVRAKVPARAPSCGTHPNFTTTPTRGKKTLNLTSSVHCHALVGQCCSLFNSARPLRVM